MNTKKVTGKYRASTLTYAIVVYLFACLPKFLYSSLFSLNSKQRAHSISSLKKKKKKKKRRKEKYRSL